MRQRMMIVVASLVAALAASTASAQAPLQTPVTSAPAAFASGCAPVVVNGCGSCAGYTTHDTTRHTLRIGGGTENPAGCGCCASEKTFLWGGCKQFFTPRQTCSGGCGCGDRFGNHCPLPQYGPGLGAPANNCAGPFSYLMR